MPSGLYTQDPGLSLADSGGFLEILEHRSSRFAPDMGTLDLVEQQLPSSACIQSDQIISREMGRKLELAFILDYF